MIGDIEPLQIKLVEQPEIMELKRKLNELIIEYNRSDQIVIELNQTVTRMTKEFKDLKRYMNQRGG